MRRILLILSIIFLSSSTQAQVSQYYEDAFKIQFNNELSISYTERYTIQKHGVNWPYISLYQRQAGSRMTFHLSIEDPKDLFKEKHIRTIVSLVMSRIDKPIYIDKISVYQTDTGHKIEIIYGRDKVKQLISGKWYAGHYD